MSSSSVKSIDRTVERIQKRIELPEDEAEIIKHMLNSVVESRDRRIRHLKRIVEKNKKPKEFNLTLATINGALRSCIKAHGPITSDFIGSASKRICGDAWKIKREPSAC